MTRKPAIRVPLFRLCEVCERFFHKVAVFMPFRAQISEWTSHNRKFGTRNTVFAVKHTWLNKPKHNAASIDDIKEIVLEVPWSALSFCRYLRQQARAQYAVAVAELRGRAPEALSQQYAQRFGDLAQLLSMDDMPS